MRYTILACSRTSTSTASVAIAGSAHVALTVCSAHIRASSLGKNGRSGLPFRKNVRASVRVEGSAAEGERGFGAEVHAGKVAREELGIGGRGDHGGIVGRERPRR